MGYFEVLTNSAIIADASNNVPTQMSVNHTVESTLSGNKSSYKRLIVQTPRYGSSISGILLSIGRTAFILMAIQ